MKIYVVLFAVIVFSQGASLDNNQRIVGGSDAPEGAYPYQISLRLKASHHHKCGGSIITQRTILTAKHCCLRRNATDFYVWAGTTKLNGLGVRFEIEKFIIYTQNAPIAKRTINDVALVILKEPIKFTNKIAKIAVDENYIDGNTTVTLTGWGLTNVSVKHVPPSTNHLQTIELKTITNKECKSKRTPIQEVAEMEMCTLTKLGEGACLGDSGGPLVANGKQVGIVAWGKPCGVNYPDVYARVSYFADWIKAHLVE